MSALRPVAIVTGAGGGIGAAITARLAPDYDLILTHLSDDVRCEPSQAVPDEWTSPRPVGVTGRQQVERQHGEVAHEPVRGRRATLDLMRQ